VPINFIRGGYSAALNDAAVDLMNGRIKMRKHNFWMIVACALPLLLVFLLPAFGVGSGGYLFIFLIFCFGLHLLMMSGHGHDHDQHGERKKSDNDTH